MTDALKAAIAAIDRRFAASDSREVVTASMVPAAEWAALRDALAAQPAAEPVAQTVTSKITIDFRQATELLELFGGEPADITLMTGDGHSGPGLYAVYNADPDGAVYLGEDDEEAVPVAAQPARAGGDARMAERVAELEDVLRSVDEQFRVHGDRLPDGFDSRVFRWVKDALAAAPQPAAAHHVVDANKMVGSSSTGGGK